MGPPIIFPIGHGDIPTTVKAMKGGATEFLLKPFDEDDLVRAIDGAIAFDRREPSRFQVTVPTREILPYASGDLSLRCESPSMLKRLKPS